MGGARGERGRKWTGGLIPWEMFKRHIFKNKNVYCKLLTPMQYKSPSIRSFKKYICIWFVCVPSLLSFLLSFLQPSIPLSPFLLSFLFLPSPLRPICFLEIIKGNRVPHLVRVIQSRDSGNKS